jgi:uncharacterized NAD(P)/FAD-binding protein YdhS
MVTFKIGIVGVGPRGLTVLERIVARERAQKSTDIQIYLFDPNEPGHGCHDPAQSEYLLVNTVAAQITMFSDSTVRDAGPVMEGPSFYEWLLDQQRHGWLGAELEDTTISADAYYSRSLFGRYLNWVFRHLCAMAPDHVSIFFTKESITRAERNPDTTWSLEAEKIDFRVDCLFLTTGHTKVKGSTGQISQSASDGATTVVSDPYPIRQKLGFVQSGMSVAIEGLGLTTFDAIAELTVCRGGRFVDCPTTGVKRYVPSGNEPHIHAFSRSGIPLSTRAINQKGVSLQYKPRFLLADKVRQLRAARQLDFMEDVFPLLLADMQYAYGEAYLRAQRDPVTTMLFCNQFVCADDAEERQQLIDQYIPAEDHFSWDRLVSPTPESALASRDEFKSWLTAYMRHDLAEAKKGNLDSPLKAASDVLRDLRDNLRAAIDFGGLTEASHRWLYTAFLPVMNRVAVGPPSVRAAEMLALMEAGVLEADWGPGAVCKSSQDGGRMQLMSTRWDDEVADIDVLIKARVSTHSPKDDSSPLLRSLLDAGHVRLFHNGSFHPGGIEIDREFNWVSEQGEVIGNAWALGIPTEGVKFYTFVVPRPGVNSTAIVDAGRAVAKMMALIPQHATEVLPQPEIHIPIEQTTSAFASMYGTL